MKKPTRRPDPTRPDTPGSQFKHLCQTLEPSLILKLHGIIETVKSDKKLDNFSSIFVEIRVSIVKRVIQSLNSNRVKKTGRIAKNDVVLWGEEVEYVLKDVLMAEFELCRNVFGKFDGGVVFDCFVRIVLGSGFVDLIRVLDRVIEGRKDANKLLRLLDVFSVMDRLRVEFNTLFSCRGCEYIRGVVRSVVRRVVNGVCEILFELKDIVRVQGSKMGTPNGGFGGGVHRFVEFVVGFCGVLVDDEYRVVLSKVVWIYDIWRSEIGDETGDETRNEIGNRKNGNETGNETRNEIGNETRNETRNVTRNETGNVTRNETRNETGNRKNGNETGNQKNGNETGRKNGNETRNQKNGNETDRKNGNETRNQKNGNETGNETRNETGDETGNEIGNETVLRGVLGEVIGAIEDNLVVWCRSFNDKALSRFFLMNNYRYMSGFLEGKPLGEVMGGDWVGEFVGRMKKYEVSYVKESWGKLPSILNDVGLILFFPDRTINEDLAKGILSEFNVMFEDLYRRQKEWVVFDDGLREKVHEVIVQTVIPPYRSYLCSYEDLVGKKSYVKYSAVRLEGMIRMLFLPKMVKSVMNKDRPSRAGSVQGVSKQHDRVRQPKLSHPPMNTGFGVWIPCR